MPKFPIFYLIFKYVLGGFCLQSVCPRMLSLLCSQCKTASETKKCVYTGKKPNIVDNTTSR